MKMKNKIKIIILICFACILLIFIGYRYHKMNSGIPQKFKNEVFNVNEEVKLDNINIKITDFKLINNKGTSTININFYTKNIGNNDVNVSDLIYDSKILYKNIIIDVPCNVEDREDNIVKCKSEKNITLSYKFPYESMEDNIKFYPSKKLYKNQIKEYIENHLLMCEKAIEIGCENIKNIN